MKGTNTKKNETIKEETTMKTTTTSHNVGKANPAVIADIRTRVTAGTVTGNTYHTLKECKRSIPKINTIMWQNLDLIIEKLSSMTDDEIADLINNGGENPVITNVEAEPILITEISTEAKAKAEQKDDGAAKVVKSAIEDAKDLMETATDPTVKAAAETFIREAEEILVQEEKSTESDSEPVLITEITSEAKASKVETDQEVNAAIKQPGADPIPNEAEENPKTVKVAHNATSKPTMSDQFIKRSEIPPFSDELLRKLRDSVKTPKDHMLVRRVYCGNWEELYPTFKHLLA